MKKLFFILAIGFCQFSTLNSLAQAPQAIPYQGVARNAAGNIIASQPVSLRISIHDGTATGTVVYSETHNLTTTALGLFNVNVGEGSVVSGTIAGVNWGNGAKFLQVEMDATGGNSYTDMGTTQLNSVPYALFAGGSGDWTKTGNNIYNSNTDNVGIGTQVPSNKLHIKTSGQGDDSKTFALRLENDDYGLTGTGIAFSTEGGSLNYAKAGIMFERTTSFARGKLHFLQSAVGDLNDVQLSESAMTIDYTGNVGIGTTAPGQRLTIAGSTTVFGVDNSADFAAKNSSGVYEQWLIPRFTNNRTYLTYGTGGMSIRNNSWAITTMALNDNGNVGIGTNNPGGILHTIASGAKTVNYSGNLFTNIATSSTTSLIKAGTEIQSTGTWNGISSKNIGLYVSSVTGGTNNYDAIFNGGGNVGIGTTSPANKLDIEGAVSIGTTYSGTSAAPTNGAIIEGNVGIGTTNVTAKLTVAGNVKIADGTQGANKVLSSDANGTATWQKSAALAYGVVNSTGTGVLFGYGVSAVTHPSTGNYTITTSNNLSGNSTVVCTIWDTNFYGFISYYQVGDNTIYVRIRNAAGADMNAAFGFAVFGN